MATSNLARLDGSRPWREPSNFAKRNCLLCKIAEGKVPARKVLEHGNFLVVWDKFPAAPIHLLVIAKEHRDKKETLAGKHPGFWDEAFAAVGEAVKKMKIEGAYKLLLNGGSYAHFSHEHIHVLGGKGKEPEVK